ncbi:MAG: transposase [Chlorobium sp.]|nr:transposase [Chlorobium sp.]
MTEKGNESRRKYSKEFKVDAVELMKRNNKSIIETAASLGIRAELLRRWEKEYSANKGMPFPGSGLNLLYFRGQGKKSYLQSKGDMGNDRERQ